MNVNNNTILITGGSAGIGFEIAKAFAATGNQVIITGRDQTRLNAALKHLPGTTGIAGDISKAEDTANLVNTLQKDSPALNIVVNNAGRAHLADLNEGEDLASRAEEEMTTNYFSVIRLNEQLLPLLKAQKEAAIINVSSIVAIAPTSVVATYSASKAALRSYTHALRISLAKSTVKVFELMPPLVNTEFSAGIGGSSGIAPAVVAEELLQALAENRYEIRVGDTQQIYDLYLQSPADALMALNS